MLHSLDLPYVLAIFTLGLAWVSYARVLGWVAQGSLNHKLTTVRQQWIRRSTARENRMFDALMLGHIMNSVTFLGSATLLVLAALVGALVNAGKIHALFVSVSDLPRISQDLFTLILLVPSGLLLVTFFLFIYALRKLGYTVALLGALPPHDEEHPNKEALTQAAAAVLTEAIKSFNNGIRGYYYAAAALFLFFSPWLSIAATLFISAMLMYRQTKTPTARAIESYLKDLSAP